MNITSLLFHYRAQNLPSFFIYHRTKNKRRQLKKTSGKKRLHSASTVVDTRNSEPSVGEQLSETHTLGRDKIHHYLNVNEFRAHNYLATL